MGEEKGIDDKKEDKKEPSIREERIRKITHLYYSNPEIQKAIFDFSTNREICPRYFEGFGKRPDALQYESDIFELVKKGATSFHCSEELWFQPLSIQTGMDEKQLNNLRVGWDLILDIDSKYIDYSKIMAEEIINFLESSGVKNIGIKYSGSKGFHLIIPWKAFPKEINGVHTKNMFPEWPRILTKYILKNVRNKITERINQLNYSEEYPTISKYIKREGGSEDITYENKQKVGGFIIDKRNKGSISQKIEGIINKEESANKEVMPDLILVSPRHLFRMPYSLHEKTALASVVLNKKNLSDFQLKDADPFKAEIKSFIPESKPGEASRFLMQALDWSKENIQRDGSDGSEKKNREYKPIQINDRSEKNFPPCVKKILLGINDGKKRALFSLINFFRSIGAEKDELEKILYSWNEKNNPKLLNGYVKSQISWALKKKPMMPPNCMEFYQGIGVCFPDELCSLIKNPVNYVVRKNFQENKFKSDYAYASRKIVKGPKIKDNFKNKE